MSNIPAAVSMTLRKVAEWVESDSDRNELYGIADQIDHDVSGLGTCPLCQEMDCDSNCPLQHVRRQASATRRDQGLSGHIT